MSLSEKQRVFAKLVGKLLTWIYENGYEVTFGDAYRSPEMAAFYANKGKGIKNSLHCLKLAIDLNLFKDGKYLDATEAHRPIGKYWESLGTEDCKTVWGGRFGDGNHYSIKHEGRA